MLLDNLVRRFTGPTEEEAEGTIQDLQIVPAGDGAEWRFRLDSRPGESFRFEPSPLSPPRRDGERVRVGYDPRESADDVHQVSRITAA